MESLGDLADHHFKKYAFSINLEVVNKSSKY